MVLFFPIFLQAQQQQKYAKIVLYRNDKSVSDDEVMKVYANAVLTTTLRNHSFAEFFKPVGTIDLKLQGSSECTLLANCNQQETYYFKVSKPKNTEKMVIESKDSVEAKVEMEALDDVESFVEITQDLQRHNSLKVILMPGIGFNKQELLVSTVGTQIRHSYGGGLALGCGYGYQLTNFFGLDGILQHRFTTLIPSVSNASVSFVDNSLSVLPYFLIPINSEKGHSLKIGASVDFHIKQYLKINTSELKDGVDDTWKYKNTTGFSVHTYYYMPAMERGAVYMGLKYENAKYTFLSGQTTKPGTSNLLQPLAQSIMAVVGMDLNFGF